MVVTYFLCKMVPLLLMANHLVFQLLSLHKVAETVTPLLISLIISLAPMVDMVVEGEAVGMDQEEEATKGGRHVAHQIPKMGKVATCFPVMKYRSWATTLVMALSACVWRTVDVLITAPLTTIGLSLPVLALKGLFLVQMVLIAIEVR